MKILFIGSDREIVYMTGKILKRNKYDVSVAVGHSEALNILGCNSFDLVVFDCDMGVTQRNSIIHQVKQQTDPPHDPPQLLVISENREDEIILLEAGADDWVQKPYHMKVLLARMAALLRQKTTIKINLRMD